VEGLGGVSGGFSAERVGGGVEEKILLFDYYITVNMSLPQTGRLLPLQRLQPLPPPDSVVFRIVYFPPETVDTDDERYEKPFYYQVSFNHEVFYFPNNNKVNIPTVKKIYYKLTNNELKDPGRFDKESIEYSNLTTSNKDVENEVINLIRQFGKKTKGGSRRRRPSRKYKKSAKRVFRKKSRSTRRR